MQLHVPRKRKVFFLALSKKKALSHHVDLISKNHQIKKTTTNGHILKYVAEYKVLHCIFLQTLGIRPYNSQIALLF